MPVLVQVFDRVTGRTLRMYSVDAAEAVQRDASRYTRQIPNGEKPDNPRPDDPTPPEFFRGESNGERSHDRTRKQTRRRVRP